MTPMKNRGNYFINYFSCCCCYQIPARNTQRRESFCELMVSEGSVCTAGRAGRTQHFMWWKASGQTNAGCSFLRHPHGMLLPTFRTSLPLQGSVQKLPQGCAQSCASSLTEVIINQAKLAMQISYQPALCPCQVLQQLSGVTLNALLCAEALQVDV